MPNRLQRALFRVTTAEQRRTDLYPSYCDVAHVLAHLDNLATQWGDLPDDAAEDLVHDVVAGAHSWPYTNGCVWCGAVLPPPATDPARYQVFTLADQRAIESYLGFGSMPVYVPPGKQYAVIGMLAEHATWQRLRLRSGLQGGSEEWSSFDGAKQACDASNEVGTH